MKAIRLGHRIITTLVRDRLYYPGRLLVDTLGLVGRCGVLLLLYWYVFSLNDGVIHGTTYQVAAWSMFFYFALSVLRVRDIATVVMQDVRSGSVETLLCKPVSYLAYRMWWQVGAGLYSFVVLSLLGGAIMMLLIGIPETMQIALFLPTVIVVTLMGIVLALAIYLSVGLLAFWIEDINPVLWIVDKSVMILGGSYLPVALFPEFLYKAALYSPFGAAKFVTHTVYESWSFEWAMKLGLQFGWAIVMLLFMVGLFVLAKRTVSVNGG